MKSDIESFREYAMKQALIVLIHASNTEDFYFRYGVVGVPLTLSAIASLYVRYKWKSDGYGGYQISLYLLGEANDTQTP